MKYSRMYRIHQRFDTTSIEDVPGAIRREFSRLNVAGNVEPGERVAVAVGSRGIHNLPAIVATVVECLRNMELKPFIFPAMGSHGGATAEGQAKLLNHLGITESSMGVPIISSMDVVSVGRLDSGAEVVISKDALEAHHFVVINRVKPHTLLRGEIESGLCKMLTVGCGKHKGALNMHKFGLASTITPAARVILEKAPVLCGLAIVENALEELHTVKLALPEQFIEVDTELLKSARRLLPKIPLEDLDILIVDEMGKNISGAGIDPNVIGFWRREGGPRKPDYRTLIVLDLTPESEGNAVGIGMVDLTTRKMMDKVDLKPTYTNAITSGVWRSARLPIALESDRVVLETALSHVFDPDHVRMARIFNTLQLENFWATEALLPELRKQEGITVDEEPLRLQFDHEGNLRSFMGKP
ncbi:MAG: lactate racemase domain-containing protein [Thermodesulfobacteriota bacterium]